jgi:tetratricopeptide (TPR) repeat protein
LFGEILVHKFGRVDRKYIYEGKACKGNKFYLKDIYMNKIALAFNVLSLATFLSCNKTDFANPEDVVKAYRTLSDENKNEKLYEDFLSSKSKEFVTKNEFIKVRNIPDSTLKLTILLKRKISSYPIDINNSTYRRFKVDEQKIFKKDTLYTRYYYSLINENGEWKIVWTGTLLAFAVKKYSDGNYSEARKTLEKIIEINPFSGDAYQQLAWCYYRDQSLNTSEWENGVVENAKYAVTLEEDNPFNYNTLAAYFSVKGNPDLAIQNFERGLSFCQNKDEKVIFYSNLVGCYAEKENYEKAEYFIKKSIEINPKSAFVWYKYGALMQEQNQVDRAIEYYEKALKEEKMENSLQGSLYYSYAVSCLDKSKCEVAREYINKAIDIEPNNDLYQSLFNKIKYCDGKSE